MFYNKSYLVILFLIISLNIFLLVKNYKLKKALTVQNNSTVMNGISDKLTARIITDATFNNTFNISEQSLVYDNFGNAFTFNNIFLNDEKKLFFRFSPLLHCNSCIVEAILHLKLFS